MKLNAKSEIKLGKVLLKYEKSRQKQEKSIQTVTEISTQVGNTNKHIQAQEVDSRT